MYTYKEYNKAIIKINIYYYTDECYSQIPIDQDHTTVVCCALL